MARVLCGAGSPCGFHVRTKYDPVGWDAHPALGCGRNSAEISRAITASRYCRKHCSSFARSCGGIKGAQSSETLTFAGKRFRQRVPAATGRWGGGRGRIVHNGRGSLLRIFSIKENSITRREYISRGNGRKGFKRQAIKRTVRWG